MSDDDVKVTAAVLRRVPETSYLNTANTHRYRPILRFFYLQHSAHRYWLLAEQVVAYMQTAVDASYTEDHCAEDLKKLVDDGNLIVEQEKTRAHTIEEFIKRQFRYQLTPYTIALERLLIELENETSMKGSLDATLLDALWERLDRLRRRFAVAGSASLSLEDIRNARRQWVEAFEYFERIVNDANDYLARMQTSRPKDLEQTEAFLAYKDILLQYLAAFVNRLVDNAERVRSLLQGWIDDGLARDFIETLVAHDCEHVPDPSGRLQDPQAVRSAYVRQLDAMISWFRRRGGVDVLRRVTADAVATVVRHTQRLVDHRRMGVSRQRDLAELATSFARCATVSDAHKLAAKAFAFSLPRHLLGSADQFTFSGAGSVWTKKPQEVTLARVRRGGRRHAGGAPIADKSREQAELLRAEIERRRREAALWNELFRTGEVEVGQLEVADSGIRVRLLEVLGDCMSSNDRTAIASDGSRIQLIIPDRSSEYGSLRAPDGELLLPRYRLRRVATEDVE